MTRALIATSAVISLLIVVAAWLIRAPAIKPSIVIRDRAQGDARMLSIHLLRYQMIHGKFPVIPADGNSVPVYASGPQQNIPSFDVAPNEVSPTGEYLDPWKRPYTFRLVGDRIVVTSAGPDGRPGTADDISNGH